MRFWRDVGEAMTEAFEITRFFDCMEYEIPDRPYRVWPIGWYFHEVIS